MDALRKMTLLPARCLEQVTPRMAAKGRVQVGALTSLEGWSGGWWSRRRRSPGRDDRRRTGGWEANPREFAVSERGRLL